MRAPSSGCLRRSAHSRSLGAPGLFSTEAGTLSFPMSWRSVAHRSLLAAVVLDAHLAREHVGERTYSFRVTAVRRSWVLSAVANVSTAWRRPLRSRQDSSASLAVLRSCLTLPLRNAIVSRDGAWSGNTKERRSSIDSDNTRRLRRSVSKRRGEGREHRDDPPADGRESVLRRQRPRDGHTDGERDTRGKPVVEDSECPARDRMRHRRVGTCLESLPAVATQRLARAETEGGGRRPADPRTSVSPRVQDHGLAPSPGIGIGRKFLDDLSWE